MHNHGSDVSAAPVTNGCVIGCIQERDVLGGFRILFCLYLYGLRQLIVLILKVVVEK